METGTTKQISQTDSKTGLTTYIRAMRPEHWVKNLLVLAAFFFALGPANSPLFALIFLSGYELIRANVGARKAAQALVKVNLDHLLPPRIVALPALALALLRATS